VGLSLASLGGWPGKILCPKRDIRQLVAARNMPLMQACLVDGAELKVKRFTPVRPEMVL